MLITEGETTIALWVDGWEGVCREADEALGYEPKASPWVKRRIRWMAELVSRALNPADTRCKPAA